MDYCAASEKSTYDVISKLKSWNISFEETENILQQLYHEKFLDDRRYARTYVSEKWNSDHWGKIKIELALRHKNISEDISEDALKEIADREYLEGLNALLSKKYKEVKTVNNHDDARRVMMFALSRGFEEDLVSEWIGKNILK